MAKKSKSNYRNKKLDVHYPKVSKQQIVNFERGIIKEDKERYKVKCGIIRLKSDKAKKHLNYISKVTKGIFVLTLISFLVFLISFICQKVGISKGWIPENLIETFVLIEGISFGFLITSVITGLVMLCDQKNYSELVRALESEEQFYKKLGE